jgi:hypothetical protein
MTLVVISVVLLGIVFGTDQCEYYSRLKLSLLYSHTPSSTPCNITDLTSFPNSQFPLPRQDVNTMDISCWPYPIPPDPELHAFKLLLLSRWQCVLSFNSYTSVPFIPSHFRGDGITTSAFNRYARLWDEVSVTEFLLFPCFSGSSWRCCFSIRFSASPLLPLDDLLWPAWPAFFVCGEREMFSIFDGCTLDRASCSGAMPCSHHVSIHSQ